MKSILKTCSLVTLGCILPISAQVTRTTEKTEIAKNPDGSITKTETTTTHTFNPEARTKVVTYFNSYKGNPNGLPPGWAARVRVEETPVEWRTTRIAPGVVVAEKQRTYLVDAPPELIKVLPAPSEGIRYYVAGSNVVAVDPTYKVVDSVQIPTIKYTDDGDEVHIEKTEGNTKTKIEIDKDDGEVEVEKEKDDD
jgi:hypothetical protein